MKVMCDKTLVSGRIGSDSAERTCSRLAACATVAVMQQEMKLYFCYLFGGEKAIAPTSVDTMPGATGKGSRAVFRRNGS
jgi:hypothetical protein